MAETTYPAPVTAVLPGADGGVSDELAAEFNRHATAWEEGAYLTMAEMFADEDYQRIIEMGPPVVPLILQRFQAKPNWWSPALIRLTGVDPTNGRVTGRLLEERKLWLEWGERQGHLSGKVAA